MRDRYFKLIDKHTKHNEDATWLLYDPTDDRYIEAIYSDFHGCYDCHIATYNESEDAYTTFSTALLTDSDLRDCIL